MWKKKYLEKPGRKSTENLKQIVSGDRICVCLYFVLFPNFLRWVHLFYFISQHLKLCLCLAVQCMETKHTYENPLNQVF